MLKFFRLALLLASAAGSAPAWTASSGLIISEDSLQLDYLTDINDTVMHNSRQHIRLMVAREQDPRNVLLMADAELLDYQQTVFDSRRLSPKLGLLYGDAHDNSFFALVGGAIIQQPPDEERRYGWISELFLAPHVASHRSGSNDWEMDFEWTWGLRLQVDYRLPDGARLNLGFRKIEVDLDGRAPSSFDTGLFLGLTKTF